MPKGYLSNRQKNLKVGISSYTENKTVLEVIGNVGIGTTNPSSKLYVVGDTYITGILTANRIFSNIYGEFTGGSFSGTDIVGTALSISGISTFTNGPVFIGSGTSTGTPSQTLQVTGGSYVSGNVGIGTTNPKTKLQVGGVIGFNDTNIRIGDNTTGCSITSGNNNFFAGVGAGRCNTTGCYNNFFGRWAGYENTTGSFNNLLGYSAGQLNTTGSYNNYLGVNAGYANTTGSNNNFFGRWAGQNNTTGCYNNFFGLSAGRSNTTGCYNNFFGVYSGFANTSGNYNNFFGCYAGRCNTTGSNNNFFGRNAGCSNATGSFNVVIGPNRTSTPILNGSNQLVIGAGNTDWIIGNSSYNVGIGTTNPTSKLHVVGDTYITGILTANRIFSNIYGEFTGGSISGTDIVGTALSISGISTLGTVKISSGIVTATSGIVTYYGDGSKLINVSTQSSEYANVAGIATYATTAGVATALQNSRTFEITGDIIASPISFNGTGNVSLAATIQPNSVALGTDTTGDYVQSVSGTSNQITVTGGIGESSTPTLSIPNQFTAPQDVTITRDLQINRNLIVNGNITIGGTSATLFTTEFKVYDPDIVLGFRTDGSGNDISTDNTANHGGIAIASTEGTPLVQLYDVGIGETNPATYKKIMWFKSGAFAGLNTDAWLINYAVGIGSTQFPSGTRLAAGSVQFTENDLAVVRNINASGIATASSFVGNLTGTATTATNLSDAANITTGTINSARLSGSYNINASTATYATSSGVSTSVIGGISSVTQLSVTGISTLGSVRISSGIVTATSGLVTYYGDGSNLTGLIPNTVQNTTSAATHYPLLSPSISGSISSLSISSNNIVFIPSTGNLGIGTTNPTRNLHVQGDFRITGGLYDTNNVVGTAGSVLTSTGAGVSWSASTGGITITDDTTTNAIRYPLFEDVTSGSSSSAFISSTKLQYNPSTGNLSATAFTSLSDKTQKTDIKPIKDALNIVKQIEGVKYKWINENSNQSIGVIAQDIEKVLPEVVIKNENGLKSVSYGNIVALLIEAIKEQQILIEKLEEKLNA